MNRVIAFLIIAYAAYMLAILWLEVGAEDMDAQQSHTTTEFAR